MSSILISLLLTARNCLPSRAASQLEVLALRHQLQVLNRSRPRRVRLVLMDRLLWAWLSQVWSDWRAALVLIQPDTVVALASSKLPTVLGVEESLRSRSAGMSDHDGLDEVITMHGMRKIRPCE